MMGTFTTTWIPEDDLALKKAVEAGASLESLAKGAVRFSRKFSLREVQERWYSLLYDPVVSTKAASGMTEFEQSTAPHPSRLNRTGILKENKVVPAKRQLESVHSCYHAMRKRIRNEPFNSMDMNFLLTPSSSNHIGNGDESFTGNFPLGDPICDPFQLEESDLDDLHCALPPGEEFSFQPHCGIPTEDLPSDFEIYELPVPECAEPFPSLDYSSPSTDWRTVEDISSSAILAVNTTVDTENYLEKLSHSLLNFTNEEEFLFMDADGKDLIDKSYYDGLNSLLNDQNEDHILNVTKPIGPEVHTNPTASCLEEFDKFQQSNSAVQMVSSSSTPGPKVTRQADENSICILNTWDMDIPSLDNISLPNRSPFSSASSMLGRSVKEAAKSNASSSRDLPSYPKAIPKDKTNSGQTHASSQRVGSQAPVEIGKVHVTADGGVKSGLPNGTVSRHVASRSEGIYNRVSKVSGTNAPLPAKLKEETMETAPVKQLSHKSANSKESYPQTNTKRESDVQMEFHDHQQLTIEAGIAAPELIRELDEQPLESDDEIPNFSDVEEMILDMDLDPEDQDFFDKEAARYLQEDAMKAIIRLEQGAQSCMQRDNASHGAFAVLYGRRSKHYIKKSEVVIGRTTEDMIVDIDLGRGGIANRISRRQAIISMENDGSFHVTNLGQFPILVNNKEVARGQSHTIAPNSLIEIRGMPFIFDINKTCVKQYMDSMAKNKTSESETNGDIEMS